MADLVLIPTIPEAPAPEPTRPSVKRYLIAAVLSTILPGAGQLFRGHRIRALCLLIGLIAIWLGFWSLRLPSSYPGLVLLLWMCLLLALFAVFDALLAKDAGSSARISRWWILAGIPLHYLATNVLFTALLWSSGFQTFRFLSESMEPTIFAGDKIVADRRFYHQRAPDRGDLVLLRNRDYVTVKRVIAVGGDTIEGRERSIYLNGQVQFERFILHKFETGSDPALDTFGPVKIPPGKFFVMGDNRDMSLDSRSSDVGPIDASAIVGRPLYGYHIWDKPHYWWVQ